MPALFTAADLTPLMGGRTVTDAEAEAAERIVWGWLTPVLKLSERPNPIPPQVFSWAAELGAIHLENPTGLAAYQLGQERLAFSSERRNAILSEAAAAGVPGAGTSPRGSFPDPCPWPDPARGW